MICRLILMVIFHIWLYSYIPYNYGYIWLYIPTYYITIWLQGAHIPTRFFFPPWCPDAVKLQPRLHPPAALWWGTVRLWPLPLAGHRLRGGGSGHRADRTWVETAEWIGIQCVDVMKKWRISMTFKTFSTSIPRDFLILEGTCLKMDNGDEDW